MTVGDLRIVKLAGFAERIAGQLHPGPWTKAPEQMTLPKGRGEEPT